MVKIEVKIQLTSYKKFIDFEPLLIIIFIKYKKKFRKVRKSKIRRSHTFAELF